ncbi:tumor necrosis factor a (TNF superfamily, member 2) isoform X1 [Girardinichthys multiradiatus]|uniref:tumor necrosis factor a (TNF superfamily, member 2) isoform X1 n=1 Tax=Girardinichthys multiradiatus TaxID=208333 RepID=UPI001FABFCF2|nr:tumor necrosis factor a (TNF superfamily, member 2) isoform X1 [Girardinichthys multiradiatus]XP_047240775.1 tumor necrosis factor a (TNF superfamily, member 2) isoform X1 [Girardinichthys multiradiatus]
MESEYKVMLDVNASIEAGDQSSSDVKKFQMSRLTMALTTFTLCLATVAALFLFSNARVKSEGLDEDSFDLHHALRQITNRRAAIHLEGEYDPTIRTSVKWMSQVDQSHSQGGLELKDNEILIPQNGLYFVYSQVSFRVSCSSRDADDITSMVHLSHTVKRWSSSFGSKGEQSYQTILHSVRTACQITASADPDSVGSWFSAVYMGAVFNLRRGDRLKTVMEEKMLENLEDESGKTFFGVFAL